MTTSESMPDGAEETNLVWQCKQALPIPFSCDSGAGSCGFAVVQSRDVYRVHHVLGSGISGIKACALFIFPAAVHKTKRRLDEIVSAYTVRCSVLLMSKYCRTVGF